MYRESFYCIYRIDIPISYLYGRASEDVAPRQATPKEPRPVPGIAMQAMPTALPSEAESRHFLDVKHVDQPRNPLKSIEKSNTIDQNDLINLESPLISLNPFDFHEFLHRSDRIGAPNWLGTEARACCPAFSHSAHGRHPQPGLGCRLSHQPARALASNHENQRTSKQFGKGNP